MGFVLFLEMPQTISKLANQKRTFFSQFVTSLTWALMSVMATPLAHAQNAGQVRIMAYNINHLFHQVSRQQGTEELVYKEIPPMQIQLKANVILAEAPDVVVLVETEGKEQVEAFVKRYLENKYVVFRLPGNSTRGVEIAMLVRRGRFTNARYQSNRRMSFRDPIDRIVKPVWSRDLPLLYLYTNKEAPPVLVIGGVHLKSRRHDVTRGKDKTGRMFAQYQENAMVDIFKQLSQQIPSTTPIIFAGDYNQQLDNSKNLPELKKVMRDAFDVTPYALDPQARMTHTFFWNKQANGQESQIDGFFISPNAIGKILDARVVPQPNCEGLLVKPASQMERNTKYASDHSPIILDLYLPEVKSL